jgi:Cu+-exporting ATPase
MACCVLTALFMSRLINACEFLDIGILKIQYNDFDDGPEDASLVEIHSTERIITTKIAIEGMTCAACVSSIEQAISTLNGIERVSVSLQLSRATVVHQQKITIDKVLAAIESRGYGSKVGERTAQQNLELLERNDEIQKTRRAFTNAAIISSSISGFESLNWFRLSSSAIYAIRLLTAALAIWIQIFDAKVVHSSAWQGRLTLSLTMDTLVSLSLALGIALSLFNVGLFGLGTSRVYWSSISFLTTVVIGGRLLDLILQKQSSSTFAKLYELQMKAMVVKIRKRNDEGQVNEQYIDTAALQPGDEIEIGLGSLVPCDCYVLEGRSLVDQSTLTGESVPVSKGPGDFLMSGTVNHSSQVVAVVYKAQEDSALECLISSISISTETPMLDTKTDLIISRFVSIILVIATFGFTLTWRSALSRHEGVALALNAACERAMAILASACPCALGLATPSAVMAGLDACRLRGVIVKQGINTFQSMSSLTHFVLDKTGTLTTGKLSVTEVEGNFDEAHRMLVCVAERESAQCHPIAQAVFRWAFSSLSESQRWEISHAKAFATPNSSGNGIEVRVQMMSRGSVVHAGSERFLLQNGIEWPCHRTHCSKEGNQILVHFAVNHQYIGRICLQDTVRREATSVVAYLSQKLHLNLSLLTGDTESEAQRISKQLGISMVGSHSLPVEKKLFIERIRNESPTSSVAMIGDGLNDAPALAAADVGISLSMSLLGRPSISHTTNSQVSDIVFTSPDLRRLPEVLRIARKTVDQSNWNTYWSVTYNSIAVALAMGAAEPFGLKIDAARAGTMMALSSISVLGWSLWLRHDLSKVSFQNTKMI